MLRLLSGLNTNYEGSIKFKGNILNLPSSDMSIVFQDYSLFPWLTIGRNLSLALKERSRNLSQVEINEKIYFYLNAVGLNKEVYSKFPNQLSGGMRQRCAICRAFLLDTDVMLMDEPFGALDAITRNNLQDMMHRLTLEESKKNKSVVFVTHDVNEALYLSDRIYVLKSSPGEVIYQSTIPKVGFNNRDEFFGNPSIIEEKHIIMDHLYDDVHMR